jgi:hypothetical protein
MRVRFTGGPLDGREEEVPDDRLEEGQPFYWPEKDALDDRDAETPGLEGAAEYLFEGDRTASYVGGQVS